jgi:hypothetical protein
MAAFTTIRGRGKGSLRNSASKRQRLNSLPSHGEKSVFEKFLQWRPWVEERVRTSQDCRELSLALAWEGDASKDCFPAADPLWLETGFQEADLERRFRGKIPESIPQRFGASTV